MCVKDVWHVCNKKKIECRIQCAMTYNIFSHLKVSWHQVTSTKSKYRHSTWQISATLQRIYVVPRTYPHLYNAKIKQLHQLIYPNYVGSCSRTVVFKPSCLIMSHVIFCRCVLISWFLTWFLCVFFTMFFTMKIHVFWCWKAMVFTLHQLRPKIRPKRHQGACTTPLAALAPASGAVPGPNWARWERSSPRIRAWELPAIYGWPRKSEAHGKWNLPNMSLPLGFLHEILEWPIPTSPLKSWVSLKKMSAVKSPLVVGLKPLRGGFEVVLLGSLGRLELWKSILRSFQDILPSQLLCDGTPVGPWRWTMVDYVGLATFDSEKCQVLVSGFGWVSASDLGI